MEKVNKLHFNAKDLTNKRFGKLKVIREEGRSSDRQVIWLCKCQCGKEVIIKAGNLKSGNSESCGCSNGSIEVKRKISKNRIGKGLREKNGSWKGGKPKCVCGKEVGYYAKKCSKCFHKELVGEKHPQWKGGITPLNKKIRMSLEYKIWRKAIFERDNFKCVWCGARSEKGRKVILQADHIKPFSLFPELRFAIDNGRTLCIDCHKNTDTYAGKIKNYGRDYDKTNS